MPEMGMNLVVSRKQPAVGQDEQRGVWWEMGQDRQSSTLRTSGRAFSCQLPHICNDRGAFNFHLSFYFKPNQNFKYCASSIPNCDPNQCKMDIFISTPSLRGGKTPPNTDPDLPTPRAGRKLLPLNPTGHEYWERSWFSPVEGIY